MPHYNDTREAWHIESIVFLQVMRLIDHFNLSPRGTGHPDGTTNMCNIGGSVADKY